MVNCEHYEKRNDDGYEVISGGTVTSPKGFLAGAVYAGLRSRKWEHYEKGDVPDLGILFSSRLCTAAGVFTTNKVKSDSLLLCQRHLSSGKARAVVVNSGCANACAGKQGFDNALKMAHLAAQKLEVKTEDMLIASTGVIGTPLPMNEISSNIGRISLSIEGGHELARAIMTTDTCPKELAVSMRLGEDVITLGGIAKGAGMIHPNMATMLCFLTTDAAIDRELLQAMLQRAVAVSFNMITIDGDTSTNDTVLLLANNQSCREPIRAATPDAERFESALQGVCLWLAKSIVRDGEGATKFIEIKVSGASSLESAQIAARTVASSPLVKTAVHGSDPNWGRVIAALGRSGVEMEVARLDIYLDDIPLFRYGYPADFSISEAIAALSNSEVHIRINMNMGDASATAWGCDLSEEYVRINSDYTT